MNKRFWSILVLLLLCVGLLAGCRCDPASVMWQVQSFQTEESFANGVELLTLHTGLPSPHDPFGGMEKAYVSISFSTDGKVYFQPGTGESLTGSYTFSHNGIRDTSIVVTLDNGETFTCTATSGSYATTLLFSFRDRDYLFQDINMEPRKYYENSLEDLTRALRHWSEEQMGDVPLRPCTISMVGEKQVLTAPEPAETILLDTSLAVRCFRLNGENQIISLDAVETGDCFYVKSTTDGKTVVTLYYIDPLTTGE